MSNWTHKLKRRFVIKTPAQSGCVLSVLNATFRTIKQLISVMYTTQIAPRKEGINHESIQRK